MQLRDYQTQAVQAVQSDWREHTDVLGVAATGAGKTQIFLAIIMDALEAPGTRGLVISHRTELVDQPMQRIKDFRPDWLQSGALDRPRVGVIQAERDDTDRQLTFATVQSLRGRRLERLLAHGPITHLIIDESHHATAESYLVLLDALRQANPGLRHLGVTATPLRADGDGLARVYQKDSFKITIADLVKLKYLVQPRWLGISTGLSLKGVHTRSGDFVQGELASVYDTPAGRRVVVGAYQQYAAGRRGIAFTASVAGAHDLAADFRAAGVAAEAIDATTPKDTRRQLLSDFRAGRITLLCNVDVLTEGFDAPGASCVLMCRPTRSDGRYIQAMGRGLRPVTKEGYATNDERRYMAAEGEDCLILDFLPQETRNIVMAGDVLGLPKETTRTVLKEQAEAEAGEVQAGFTFDGHDFNSNGTPLEIISRELHYLEASIWTWHRRDGLLTLGCGRGGDGKERILAIKEQQLWGIWRDGLAQGDGSYKSVGVWAARPIPADDPFAVGEQLAAKHATQELVAKGRGWHKLPISEGQAKWLHGLARGDMKRVEIDALTRGQAAGLITHYQAAQAIARYEAAAVSHIIEVA